MLNERGMIVVGFPGVGKTSCASKHHDYIDLESSWFHWKHDMYIDAWQDIYCKTATELSKQGFTVFVSSHSGVVKRLKNYSGDCDIFIVLPSKNLKEVWEERVRIRWEVSGSDKDYAAWQEVVNNFDEDVEDLLNSGLPFFVIEDMNYNLCEIVMSMKHLKHQ